MISFDKHVLENGLTLITHLDESTPLVAINTLYKIGSRNEHPSRTGFAHLFEHLMFGGSKNAPDFDTPIQIAGGDNNAFTNCDLTNFYDVMPAENLETALWLESDRMLQLNIDSKSLDVQKKVVVEEFKETSINRPYGDLWHELSALAFQVHPYKWPTIGLVPEHIEQADLSDVKTFFENHYCPDNAVLVISGKFDPKTIVDTVEKWFGNIPKRNFDKATLVIEPEQTEFRQKILKRAVPSNALYMAFHMPARLDKDFMAYDILSDVFNGGRSSRFYQNLIKNENHFSHVDAFISASEDPGLFIIEAKLLDDTDLDEARALIWKELENVKSTLIDNEELQKAKNGLISSVMYSEVSILHKAINLAYFEMLDDASLINNQEQAYNEITVEDLQRIAQSTFKKENCSEIIYIKNGEAVEAYAD